MIRSSTALRRVRRKLNERNYFICCLLNNCEGFDTQVARDLKELFPGDCPVDSWLSNNCPEYVEFCEQATDDEFYAALHTYRKAWVDQMILDYAAKGD